jgi:hypothetical protein
MSQPSSQGRRQERRGPHTASALPGPGAAARASSLARTRAATTELAAHRRRSLAISSSARSTVLALDSPPTSCDDDTEAGPGAALLFRVEPASARRFNRERAPQAAQGAAGLKGQRERGYVSKRFASAFGLRRSHHLHDNGKGSTLAVA